MYRIYFTDVPLPPGLSEPDYNQLLPLEYATAEEAATRAVLFVRKGYIVWKIEGPNGFFVNWQALEAVMAAAERKPSLGH
ncbi:MAG: hypothetical protein ABIS45_12315 [Burkholderiales bacterium]